MMKKLFSIGLVSLLTGFTGQAQQEQAIVRSFAAFAGRQPHEKLFVHTDKELYLAGEIIWFKVYREKGTGDGSVAYVDLLDASGKTVLAAPVSMEGNNNGSLLLPLSVNSGGYQLRAYTSWMKNSPGELFFEKAIRVLNPFKNPDSSLMRRNNDATAGFFPEGGQMVKGLEGRLAFKLTDGRGKGIAGNGAILNSRNDTVARFSSFRMGMGSFLFTPHETRYRAVIRLADGSVIQSALPDVQDEGYVMTVQRGDGTVEVSLQSSYTGPQALTLAVRNKAALTHTASLAISKGRGSITIPLAKLGEGVSQITVFNALNQPVSERLVFTRPAANSQLVAETGKDQFGQREKISLALKATTNGKTAGADLSVAVYPLDFHDDNVADIQSYFWLTSELRGNVESPAFYFSDDPDAAAAADNLMLTQGWRRYTWSQVLQPTPSLTFQPELSGHTIRVQVSRRNDLKPAPGREVFLSIPGTHFNFSTGHTDEHGVAAFHIKEIFGAKKLVVQLNHADAADYEVKILSPFYTGAAPHATAMTAYPALPVKLLEHYSINMQVQNIYHADSMRIFYAHDTRDTTPFYGRAMYRYHLDTYTRFKTMEEVLREYVRELAVGARNGKLYLKIADEARKEFNEENLLVLWDGVALQDPHSIFSFDPLKVKKLEVVPRKFAAGGAIFNGLASFSTYNGDLAGYTPPRDNVLEYDGLQLQREFYSPSYDTGEKRASRVPDFRNTLYWSPNVLLQPGAETTLQFYSGDRKGKYIALVQGLDPAGNPLTARLAFEVK